MTALLLAAAAFACAGLAGLFAYVEHRLHRAKRRGGRVLDVFLIFALVGAVAFTLQLVQEAISW